MSTVMHRFAIAAAASALVLFAGVGAAGAASAVDTAGKKWSPPQLGTKW